MLTIQDGYSRPDKGCPFPTSKWHQHSSLETALTVMLLSEGETGEVIPSEDGSAHISTGARQAQHPLEELSSWLRGAFLWVSNWLQDLAGTRNWGSGSSHANLHQPPAVSFPDIPQTHSGPDHRFPGPPCPAILSLHFRRWPLKSTCLMLSPAPLAFKPWLTS